MKARTWQNSVSRRRDSASLHFSVFLAFLCFVLLVCGCSQGLPPPRPLQDLHLAGVTQIPGIAALRSKQGQGVIGQIVAYQPDDGSALGRVLFDVDGELYDVGLDGSGLRRLGITCTGPFSATSNGRWVACQQGFPDNGIEIAQLRANGPVGAPFILTNPEGTLVGEPTWAPDSHHLAVVSHIGGCSIAVFSISPSYDAFQLAAVFTFPELATPGPYVGCSIFALSWSPDGDWLAFVDDAGPPRTPGLYSLHLAALSPRILQSVGPPIRLTLRRDSLVPLVVPLIESGVYVRPSWARVPTASSASTTSGALMLTYVERYNDTIARVDVSSRQHSTLLKVDEGAIDAISWTPDYRHLVFALGSHSCVECPSAFTPLRLYADKLMQ